jgi:hypothetical protein
LKGDGKGKFKPIDVSKTGFLPTVMQRDLQVCCCQDKRELMIIANNDSPMQTYVTRNQSNYYAAAPGDAYALITLKDGRQRKHEFYFGSTYLSNSSRVRKNSCSVLKDIKIADLEVKVGDKCWRAFKLKSHKAFGHRIFISLQ